MKKLAFAVPVCALVGVVQAWRVGLVAPLLYGVRLWSQALRPEPCNEADWVG